MKYKEELVRSMEALARYEVANSVTTITKEEALRKSTTFIQNVHH